MHFFSFSSLYPLQNNKAKQIRAFLSIIQHILREISQKALLVTLQYNQIFLMYLGKKSQTCFFSHLLLSFDLLLFAAILYNMDDLMAKF